LTALLVHTEPQLALVFSKHMWLADGKI
jgi:hypothetical protein